MNSHPWIAVERRCRSRGFLLRAVVGLGLAWLLGSGVGKADIVILKSGEELRGTIVQENALEVILDSETAGRLTLSRDLVESVEATPLPAPDLTESPTSFEGLTQTSLPLTTPPRAPNLIPLAPPPSLPEATNFVARMYWDGRLRYELSTRLTLNDPILTGSTWLNDRFRLRGRIGAKLAIDGAEFVSGNGQQQVPGAINVRAFRVLTEGEIGLWLTNQYSVELGLVDGEFYLNKVYYRLVDVPHFGDLTAGYFTVPQTLENVMGYGTLMFMESSSGAAAFNPGSRTGIEWNRSFLEQRMTAAFGVFSVGQNQSINAGDASQVLAQPTLRVTGLPWAERDRWLHFGASSSFVFSGQASIQYQARPESRLAPFLVNTGSIDAHQATVMAFEAACDIGPLLVQSELVSSEVWSGGPPERFYGGYVAAGWVLTGESHPYDRAKAAPGRVQPDHPLWGKDAGWGAWEVGGRFSMVDLSDGVVQGGQMKTLMLGVNWYWNRYLRWQFNYGFSQVTGGSSPGNLNIFQARLESQF